MVTSSLSGALSPRCTAGSPPFGPDLSRSRSSTAVGDVGQGDAASCRGGCNGDSTEVAPRLTIWRSNNVCGALDTLDTSEGRPKRWCQGVVASALAIKPINEVADGKSSKAASNKRAARRGFLSEVRRVDQLDRLFVPRLIAATGPVVEMLRSMSRRVVARHRTCRGSARGPRHHLVASSRALTYCPVPQPCATSGRGRNAATILGGQPSTISPDTARDTLERGSRRWYGGSGGDDLARLEGSR